MTYDLDVEHDRGFEPGLPAGRGSGPLPAAPGSVLVRWLPLAAAVANACVVLLISGTSVVDIGRYAFYVVYSLVIPGTLVFRVCRSTPHTLVEDLAYGTVTGLTLEILGWGVFSATGLQSLVILWPLAVILPFTLVPRLRRHWRPGGYTRVPRAWSWAVALLVCGALWYLYGAFFIENPILPTSETTWQFQDLAYQTSLAANAKHHFPLTLPQVAGEPLNYHWFAFVHMAMTSMIGGLDLSVIEMRFLIPGLTALMLVVTSVTGWRLAGRSWAGPVAAALFFAIGEFGFTYPNSLPFGSPEVILMVWASFSMTYSQPILMALIGSLGDMLRHGGSGAAGGTKPFGRGAFVLVGLFAFTSSVAKASSLPVTLAALGLAGLVALIRTRRIPWLVVGLAAIVAVCQIFSTAAVFKFQSYGLQVQPLSTVDGTWVGPTRSTSAKTVIAAMTAVAFLLYAQLRVVGIVPLLIRRRLRMSDREWFLIGGVVAGTLCYLLLTGFAAGYFMHAGFAFGVLLSAAGFMDVFERARMSRRATLVLVGGGLAFAVALTCAIYRYASGVNHYIRGLLFKDPDKLTSYFALIPILTLGAILAAIALAGGVAWLLLRGRVRGLRGRGPVVLLAGALLAGAPTLPLDVIYSSHIGWWGQTPTPASTIAAARWIRAHSDPSDVVVTDEHCWSYDDYAKPNEGCVTANSFWLAAYSERSTLVSGWGFAPRLIAEGTTVFWDRALLKKNDDAISHPTAALLSELATDHHVRYIMVDRKFHKESPDLPKLARLAFDNGRMAVYEITQ